MKSVTLVAVFLPFSAFAQGPLPPPVGPPVASMKTLDQVEARIPITAATAAGNANGVHVITTSGSYYLTADVQGVAGKDGIVIEANNVTLDLNGYSLKGIAGSLNGIGISRTGTSYTGLTVRNGFITGFGQRGIHTVSTGAMHGFTAEDLTISCTGAGLRADVAGSTVVRRVIVRGGAGGILCAGNSDVDQIEDCVVTGTTGEAILGDVIERCQVSHVNFSGLVVIGGSRISHCRVANISCGVGVVGIYGDEVDHCVVSGLICTGAGPIDGVQGDLVTATRVLDLTSAGGNVRGIGQRNSATNGSVTHCAISGLKTTSTGTVIGAEADSVSDCQLSRIGFESSTGAVTGILFGSRVDDCTLRGVGHAGVTGNVRGISLSDFATGGAVSRVVLQDFKGAGPVSGIRAGLVEHATITKFVQNGGGFTGNQAIAADNVAHCLVSDLVANTSVSLYAVIAEFVTDTRVETVSNGGGTANGISGEHIVDCTVFNLDGIGINGSSSASRISGCSVRSAALIGIEYNGQGGAVENNAVRGCATGIQTTSFSTRAVVRGNQVTTCPVRYDMNANSVVGPIATATGTIASTSPFVNFSD